MHIAPRIIADIVLFASVFLLPWWITLALAVVFFFVFESYGYEMLAAAFAADLLYGVPEERFGSDAVAFTLGALLLLLLLIPIRRRIRV